MGTKNIAEHLALYYAKKGYQITYTVEATEADASNMVYFDPCWAITDEERKEFPNGREVIVSGEFECHVIDGHKVIAEVTRGESGVAFAIIN